MKIKSQKQGIITVVTLLLLVFSSHMFLSFTYVKLADDIWKLLGVSQQDGTEKIKASFTSGYPQIYGLRNIKNIVQGKRAEVTKDLLLYTRKYLSSPEFKNYYIQHRLQLKPVAPPPNPKSKEEIKKGLIEEIEKSIKDSEKTMQSLPDDLKKIFQESIDMSKKQVEEYKRPENEMLNMMAGLELQNHNEKKKRYETELLSWESNFPAEVSILIKKRLQQFTDLGTTVDFDAELVEANGKKKFVKTEYERKPAEWKAIFRAGKEVYLTSKEVVAEWMKELK